MVISTFDPDQAGQVLDNFFGNSGGVPAKA